MSTLDADLDATGGGALELSRAREALIGDLAVRRLLPLRLRRSVGAWCFADHYGPLSVDGVTGMDVPPHPHIGLQTVTWLMAGNVLHRDSLGSEQMIRPGQLNLMTAGRGIAHAEESPEDHDPELHGVQLWIALPEVARRTGPAFEHHAQLPATRIGALAVTVLLGSLAGLRSPATTFSPVVGAELTASDQVSAQVELDRAFEHAVFVTTGTAAVQGRELSQGSLLYLGKGREQLDLAAAAGTSLMLLGGVPLAEPLLMWWNFVARTPEEILVAVRDWDEGRYGEVGGYEGAPLVPPPLDVKLLRRRSDRARSAQPN